MARRTIDRRHLLGAAVALALLIEGPVYALGEPGPEPALQVRSKVYQREEPKSPLPMLEQLYFSQALRVAPPAAGSSIKARTRVSGFRSRSVKVVRYAQPVRFGQSDYLVKLEAPGKRSTIVSLELVFF